MADIGGFQADVDELEELGESLRSWLYLAYARLWRTCRTLLCGEFDSVEASAAAMLEVGGRQADFVNAYAAQILQLRREQGRLDELRPMTVIAVEQNPSLVAFRLGLAVLHLDTGEFDEARRHFEHLAENDFDAVPRDFAWLISLVLLCEVAATLGDAARSRALYDKLEPFSGTLAASGGIVCLGAVDRYLGMAAATTGDLDAALVLYDRARALEKSVDATPLSNRTAIWLSRALLARNGPGDGRLGREVASDAARAARSIGQSAVAASLEALARGMMPE